MINLEKRIEKIKEMTWKEFIDLPPNKSSELSSEEVQELAKAKAEGRLMVLPCKPETKVYRVWKVDGREPVIDEYYAGLRFMVDNLDNFGKTVFLTREAAEKAIAEVEEIMKKLDIDAADVFDIVTETYTESDIVSLAIKGLFHGSRSGSCVFDLETHELRTRSLGSGESTQDATGVTLYTIEQNILVSEPFTENDWFEQLEETLVSCFDWGKVAETIRCQFEVL